MRGSVAAGAKRYVAPRKRGYSKNGRGDAPQIVVGLAVTGFSVPVFVVAYLLIWLVSLIDRSRQAAGERIAFEAQFVRSQTGIGASGATAH